MKTVTKIITLIAFGVFVLNSQSVNAADSMSKTEYHLFIDNVDNSVYTENTENISEDCTRKKPWWVFLTIEIKFGMNIPDCQCCYNGICSISAGKIIDGGFKYDSEEQLARFLNKSGKALIAVTYDKEVYILVGSNNKSDEFEKDFTLNYLPEIDDEIISRLAQDGIELNMKKRQYVPEKAEAGYKMIKLSS